MDNIVQVASCSENTTNVSHIFTVSVECKPIVETNIFTEQTRLFLTILNHLFVSKVNV